MTKTEQAVKHLCEKLSEDEDFYYGWQSNIAMAFLDEYTALVDNPNITEIHKLANKAAKRFLDNLIYSTLSPAVEYEDDRLDDTRGGAYSHGRPM